jgi:hypothetical protein
LRPIRFDSVSAHGFRICFTPLDAVLFTLPSRYWCAIGRRRYLALEGGPPGFQRDLACPAVLPDPTASQTTFAYGTLTLSGRPFQRRSASRLVSYSLGLLPSSLVVRPTPHTQRRQALTGVRFRLLPFRSPLLREYSLLLGVREMFQFPRCPSLRLCVQRRMTRHHPRRVAPFGFPRLIACPRLPEAFRRVATSFVGRRRQGIHRAPSAQFSSMPMARIARLDTLQPAC